MKVAIDITPLKTGHQFRGIGFYTKNLVKALKKFSKADFQVEVMEKGNIPKEVDLVHYPFFELFWLTLPWRKVKKTIVTIHDLTPLIFPKKFPPGIKGKARFQIQKLSLKGVEAVICDSQNSKRDVVKYLGFPRRKIFVVYLAGGEQFRKLKPGKWEEKILKKYRLPGRFVLYVGDVNYNKNILGLIRACKKIAIPLVIVGKQAVQKEFDGAHIENQPLVQLIKLYGRDPDVIRLGFVPDEDLVAIYNLATVYCQPSFYEGFGLPILQAMACGTPVVASRESSLPEVAGEAAVLVNPYKIDRVAHGLTEVIDSEKLREDLIRKGLAQAKEFSWGKTAKETIKVYKKVYEKGN